MAALSRITIKRTLKKGFSTKIGDTFDAFMGESSYFGISDILLPITKPVFYLTNAVASGIKNIAKRKENEAFRWLNLLAAPLHLLAFALLAAKFIVSAALTVAFSPIVLLVNMGSWVWESVLKRRIDDAIVVDDELSSKPTSTLKKYRQGIDGKLKLSAFRFSDQGANKFRMAIGIHDNLKDDFHAISHGEQPSAYHALITLGLLKVPQAVRSRDEEPAEDLSVGLSSSR